MDDLESIKIDNPQIMTNLSILSKNAKFGQNTKFTEYPQNRIPDFVQSTHSNLSPIDESI